MKFKKDSLPVDIKERLKYLYRFQEMLRLFHNEKAKEFHNGKMKEIDFRRFQKGWFEDRNQFLSQEINKCVDNISELAKSGKLSIGEEGIAIKAYKEARKDKSIHIEITDIEE